MRTKRILKINGTPLDKTQLEKHLQKIASSHNLVGKSTKQTYPVPHLLESFEVIQNVYNLLNEHLKLGIGIHPAGEWLLDNLYAVEESVKEIEKELTLKKYTSFLGIANGQYKGFARIYVLASEIVAYTDNKIERKDLEDYLASYQTKKTLSMEEIWNIGIFLKIAIIENIREVCEKIFISQMEKYKAENIVERLVESKSKQDQIFKNYGLKKIKKNMLNDMGYSFVEYMSYILKRYGKKGYSYLKSLEEVVELTGTTVSEIIKKEHFDIAVRKVSIGNSITSIKRIQRINFLEIFEKINGVEELLKKDPSGVYERMDNKTKEYYRNKIKEISKKTKISEIYITKKLLEIANKNEEKGKKSHIGYYLIDEGINELYKSLKYKRRNSLTEKEKSKIYINLIFAFSLVISFYLANILNNNIDKIVILIISWILFFIPVSEIVNQVISYILSKIVKPKLIPKLDFSEGIDKENSTMVVIPTIINSKEKVKELIRKLEVFYLANKSENIYFCLLGDCTQSSKKEESFDIDIIKEGKVQTRKLNEKYESSDIIPIFNFIYRKREWNEKEGSYLGWERKRGMLSQFNEYLLGNLNNPFRENTIENYENKEEIKEKLRNIKYIITLDADTDLILDSAFGLVGAMAHILNKPEIDKKTNIVTAGYGIMQPRIGINLNVSNYNLFTKIFAGAGGIDSYTNAISDLYQDNFKEGIFTGKGIYDLKIYSKVLKNQIPENTVLSHDLLEGCYLRCGLVSDIMLMDGYPTKYNSFINRLSRWIRGDVQIVKWISSKKHLNLLSRYKIFDNLRRSLLEISIMFSLVFTIAIGRIYNKNIYGMIFILLGVSIIPFILEFINYLAFKKNGEQKQKTFTTKITGIKGSFIRGILTLGCIPYKAYVSLKSIFISLYRMIFTHKHLLEWMTSEEAEKNSKSNLLSYLEQMLVNIILGAVCIITGNIFAIAIGLLWIIIPLIMWYISRKPKEERPIDKLNVTEKEYIKKIGEKTWEFFSTYLIKENNYLITDNYQEDRKEKIVSRTSSTNIGLSLLAVISASDMGYINKQKALRLLKEILLTIESLPKWNGHLYNWYQIKKKEPLIPRYISTVDSGNFVGYLFVVKSFFKEVLDTRNANVDKEEIKKEEIETLILVVDNLIKNTNFSVLYNKELQMFSIGFNVEENKLTDSYYDLLASEARQASLVAIAKKDVPSKHWNCLSRTLTTLGKYKGLISWSGTAFEYLMPDINIPRYKGSLLDESCKFMIMSQMEYSKKLNIPWGISEAAFNVKDLKSNYQYKAFGIPWLGLKRGLGDELVVSSYGSILAILDCPKEEIENLKRLEKEGMYNKFGFYESIDYTPERVEKGKTSSIVKTYMAHHQGLILLSINNLFNDKILTKRFINNPELEAVSILLQETMPEMGVTTKEEKEKVEKLRYKDYEDYIKLVFNKIDERLITGNIISSEDYVIAMNQKGEGVSKYKDIYINRYKNTADYHQGIFFVMKNIKTKRLWSSNYSFNKKKENYKISFMPDKVEQEIMEGNIKTTIKTTISSTQPVELRRVILENQGNDEEIVEVNVYFEPVLSKKEDDYAHQVFNNLFLITKYDNEQKSLIIKRKKRDKNTKEMYLDIRIIHNKRNNWGFRV